jgi:hypothetical protein
MTPASFEDIAIQLVATDRSRAQFQARDIGARLAATFQHPSQTRSAVPYNSDEARAATRARNALIKELAKSL